MSLLVYSGLTVHSIAIAALLGVLSAPSSAPPPPCPPVAGVDSILIPGRVTLFGEMHGTQQSPAFVAKILCHAAARHTATTLGVELPVESTPVMDRYIHSRGDSGARAALFADTIWTSSYQDGRTSEAMFALLETARQLIARGAQLRILPFSHLPINGIWQARDSAMAETLAEAVAKDRSGVLIVLTGNVHSQIAVGIRSDTSYRPMGYLLRALVAPGRVLGLNVTYDSGSAWICTGATAETCGARELRGRAVVGPDSIRLGTPDRAYDGRYGVGALVASPPALQGRARLGGSGDSLASSVIDDVLHRSARQAHRAGGQWPTPGFRF